MQWNATGVTVAGVTGMNGSALNKLSSPMGIYVYPNDSSLYIADTGNQRIVKWLSGAVNGTIVAGATASPGLNPTSLSKPNSVFVDSMQNMYVVDLSNGRIQFFRNGSTTATTVSSSWTTKPDKPFCVYVMNNQIYVCDNGLNVILRNGSQAAGKGAGPAGEIQHSQGLVVDENDTMYIANMDHHVIVKWPASTSYTSAGTVVAGNSVGTAGSTSILLNTPTSVTRDSQGNLYVVDQGNHRIQLFCQYPTPNTSGITIGGIGTPGSTPTALSAPTSVALDSSLNVYVSDTGNHRIQMFQRIA
ncbi:unnamed protein product [Rotaria sp. Silwood2]|nr:unnamed protein product [Rotaria sp. Silwood2]CAF4230758.1 unnamed protein product [Rotaria sp. Silwood2]